ncbi:hypothetical protein ABIA22_004714 [Sinorhizobium fredii]|uniref:hypothetical protein n=1 Tax=Rhizobium fredii TaxID=380 RepID=UPI003519BB1B
MEWKSKGKELPLSKVTGHGDPRPLPVKGRAPAVKMIHFTPTELYGAMARCSHLHVVNSDAVTAESETCRHLLSQYVDENGDRFAILKAADRLKDFSRTHLAGVVGAGLAYLQMIRDGYHWFDHFENLRLAGSAPTKKSPDFVFSRRGDETVAVSESKATRGSSRAQFDGTVKRGYLEQVSPYLGLEIGSAIASHGFAIGAWMTSPVNAEILVHHTAPPAGSVSPGGHDDLSDPTVVRRGNYLNALSLLFGQDIADAARAGRWPAPAERFVTARWLGHDWLLGFDTPRRSYLFDSEDAIWLDDPLRSPWWRAFNGFALEWEVARRFFSALEPLETKINPLDNLPEIDDRLILEARSSGSAVFPDGFAVIANDAGLKEISVRPLDEQGASVARAVRREEAIALRQDTNFDEYQYEEDPKLEAEHHSLKN